MALRLRLRESQGVPVEVEGITPDALREQSRDAIARLPIFEGNRQAQLGDFFDIQGDASDAHLIWEGDLRGVHWIGAKMTAGRIDIESSAGRHVGSEMRGGEIHVQGDVGDWVGGEMHGGLIHVHGRAGHLVGAAYRGSARGMTRGTIIIHGDAGNEIGHTMRRGLIAIGGNIGDLAGFNMLAGSILLLGTAGIRHAAGMRRGTLAFLHPSAPPLLPSFRRACRLRPLALHLLLRHLAQSGLPISDELWTCTMELYNGDMIEGGRGEILVRAQQ